MNLFSESSVIHLRELLLKLTHFHSLIRNPSSLRDFGVKSHHCPNDPVLVAIHSSRFCNHFWSDHNVILCDRVERNWAIEVDQYFLEKLLVMTTFALLFLMEGIIQRINKPLLLIIRDSIAEADASLEGVSVLYKTIGPGWEGKKNFSVAEHRCLVGVKVNLWISHKAGRITIGKWNEALER